jgi:TolB protein
MITSHKACLRFTSLLALMLAAAVLPSANSQAQTAARTQPQSPNGKILFQSTQGSDNFVNEIYTMDAEGKHQVRLTYNDFDDASPVWSPQGDRIAFLSMRSDAGYDIYLISPDGTGERPLRDADHGGPLITNNIEWSPDGKKIMFNVGGKISVVEVIAADGSLSLAPVQNLSASAPSYAFDSDATWSQGGSKIAFISNACATCFPDLFVINADGSGRTQLTTTPDAEGGPRWTPTGSIAYTSFRDGSANTYVINDNGTGDHLLTGVVPDVSNAIWSPDGTRIIFNSSGPASAPRSGLYLINVDGSGLVFLTDEANGGGRVLWSPDGNKIVAHTVNDANCIDVISFDANPVKMKVTNMTKTRKADEFAWSWQRLPTQ